MNPRRGIVVAATAAGLGVVLAANAARGTSSFAGPTTTTGPSRGSGSNTTTSVPDTVESATGTLEDYGYGELSLRVTVRGSRITAVHVVTLRTHDNFSQTLANQSIPTLRREVLAAQSPDITGVSGATYTSEAYSASVQSALDKLHR